MDFIDRGCGFVEMSAHETNNSRMWLQGGYVCILIPKFHIKELRLGCVLIRQCKYVINICRFDVCETNAIWQLFWVRVVPTNVKYINFFPRILQAPRFKDHFQSLSCLQTLGELSAFERFLLYFKLQVVLNLALMERKCYSMM
jgi:hypothetical protein